VSFADDKVGATVDPLDHVGDELRPVREVRVHQQGAVTLGAVGPLQRDPQQLLNGGRVAQALPVADHREREDLGIGGEGLRGSVGRSVIGHQELILAAELGENLPDLPQQQPDRVGLVVAWNADVDHVFPFVELAPCPILSIRINCSATCGTCGPR